MIRQPENFNTNYQSIFRTIRDMYEAGKSEKVKAGIWQANELFKDEMMFVLRNINFTFDVNVGFPTLNEGLKPDLPWALDHFVERVSGKPTNPGKTYKYWPYANFKDGDDPYMHGKKFSHTYQERFWPKKANGGRENYLDSTGDWDNMGIRYTYGDLNDVMNQLKENPLTRQAYLPIFFPEDTGAVHKQRVPCTLGYYFYISRGRLHCNYIIRSCDVYRHFRNDLYLTSLLLRYVSNKLDILTGTVTIDCFNLHLFESNLYSYMKRESKYLK